MRQAPGSCPSYPAIAKLALELSSLAYQEQEAIRDGLMKKSTSASKIHFIESNRLSALVFKLDETIWVVFRGSHTWSDWISNIDIRFVATRFGRIHRGFYDSLTPAFPLLINAVESFPLESCRLCFAGHSRGGAFAVIAAAMFRERGHRPTGIYTFGQPRVGDQMFTEWWNTNMDVEFLRFVNGTDVVPRLPPSSIWEFGLILTEFGIEITLKVCVGIPIVVAKSCIARLRACFPIKDTKHNHGTKDEKSIG